MIERTAMMAALQETCPEFAPACDAFVAEWSDEPEIPYYLLLGDFSRYIVGLLVSDDRKQLRAAFDLIESFHQDGDAYVREAATIGILENIQNTNLHDQTTPDQFVEYLQPISLKYWRKLYDFWERGTIITDD
ncbi:MAG: hypothetical protein GY880_31100 [Planctomycetaceae bacterium]|nr:hypothetical protein [Planctomycetaceae bacterium]